MTNATWTNSRGESIRVWAEYGYAWPTKADAQADRPVVAMYSETGACTGPSGGRVVRDSANVFAQLALEQP